MFVTECAFMGEIVAMRNKAVTDARPSLAGARPSWLGRHEYIIITGRGNTYGTTDCAYSPVPPHRFLPFNLPVRVMPPLNTHIHYAAQTPHCLSPQQTSAFY